MEKARVSGDRKTMKVIGGFSKMRKLQKTISFLLSLVLTLGLCIATVPGEVKAAEGVQFTVTADKTELQRGDTVKVTVSMSGNTEGYGLNYELVFDSSKLEPVGKPEPGEVFNGAMGEPLVAYDGKSVTAGLVNTSAPLKNGTLMSVEFKVKDTATTGETGFQSVIDLVAEYGEPLTVSADNAGSIKLNIVTPVDRNPVKFENAGAELNIVIPVTGITLSKSEMNMVIGQTDTLTATLAPEGVSSAVAWKSTNEAVATVAQDGTVTAVSSGNAVITATAGGISAECKVSVEAPKIPMTGISVSDMEINRGQTKTVEVSYSPADTTDDKTVTYESSDKDVAVVDNAGVVTGKKEGTATITVKTTGTATPFTATAVVKVNEKSMTEEAEDKIAFTGKEMEVLKGQTVSMMDFLNVGKVLEENGITDSYTVKWSVSEEKVAALSTDGKLTGVKEGETEVTAELTFTNGAGEETGKAVATTKVAVKEIPLESIAFDKVIKEMVVGTSETLSIIYNPNNTTDLRDVKWETSDSSILSVENGKVTALKVGEAEITATVGDKKASCKITVKEGSVKPTPGQDKADGIKKDSTKTDNSPKTGDTADVVLYVLMFALSMAVVLFACRRRFCKAGR